MKKLIIIILLSIGTLNAQTITNNGAIIAIAENTTLSALNLENNGTIINRGRLYIRGAWQNNADYQSESGTLALGGNSRQDVDHQSRIFGRLEITGGGEKVFTKDILVLDELVLTEGVLKSENDSKLFFGRSTTVSGGSDLSYVEGPIVNIGPGNKVFPVGAGGTYYPIKFIGIGESDLELQVDAITPNPLDEKSGIIEGISENIAWQVTEIAGEWGGSQVEVAVRNENFGGLIQDVVVAHGRPDGAYQSIGQTNFVGDLVSGTITSNLDASYPLISYGFLTPSSIAQITVFNALSPNGDGLHDYLHIENIESYPNNVVALYNRMGNKVFEQRGYDNNDQSKRFEGFGNEGIGEVPDGTYFYTIDPGSNDIDKVSGFFVLKR